MFAFLMAVGIAGTIVSLFALGFGFSYNGFDLGNTLIGAGATGLGAGLVLIGLAAAVRELQRIAEALHARSTGRPVRPAETAEVQAAGPRGAAAAPCIPYPPKPVVEPPVREARPVEPRFQAPGPEEGGADNVPPRPNIFAAARNAGEPPMMEEPDMAPLAPMRPPPAAPMVRPPGPPPAADPAYEPKFGPADILARLSSGRAAPAREPMRQPPERPVERAVEPPPPVAPERASGNMFESVWPVDGAPPMPPARSAGPDSIARAPKPEPRPETSEPRYEAKRPRAEPPPPPPPAMAEPPPAIADARAISILKSGVIDGMAYTLYTDGSIEAQLPQGTMHFASIEELRLHLERHG